MKLSDYIIEFLAGHGCTHIFGYPGGAVTHLIDSACGQNDLQFIGTCHEQAAAFAAEGYARIKNDIGTAIATSGPGATNLITGIASAYFDSIPCLYLTGQVNTYEYKGSLDIRQAGFQETDIVSIVTPITKYAVRITDPRQIKYELEKAISIAMGERKGPVLLDIPMDIQNSSIEPSYLTGYTPLEKAPRSEGNMITHIEKSIHSSKRPVLLAGGGVRSANAAKLLEETVRKFKIPVVTTLMGKDSFDNSNEYYCGMIGTYGNRYANFTLANADFILALGTRLDSRQTGTDRNSFAREARLIRVDIDPRQAAYQIKEDEYFLNMDLGEFLPLLNESSENKNPVIDWIKKVEEYKELFPSYLSEEISDPNYIMHWLSKLLGPEDVICTDVGQNQMWAAQSLCITKNQRFLTSGGMGAMGFSLPCAIGACYAGVKGSIYAVVGDGGLQMNIQELETIKRNNLPIKIIIMNNHCLGMIRHFQEMYFDSRYNATIKGYSAPDFNKLAQAYGITSAKVTEFETLVEILSHEQACIADIQLPQYTYVYPKLSVNYPIEEQEPLLDRTQFLKNMVITPYEKLENQNAYQTFVHHLLDSYKCKQNKDLLKLIPVTGMNQEITGYLHPITNNYEEAMPECISLFTKWRNENPDMSLEPCHSTLQSTRNWLNHAVLERKDRILFLITAADGTKLGHIGFSTFIFEDKSCEIDAVLRGEHSGYKGMMSFSLNSLIYWGIKYLRLEKIRLRVRNDNQRAIQFYLNNHFCQLPMDLEFDGGPFQDCYYLNMELDMKKWKENYYREELF